MKIVFDNGELQFFELQSNECKLASIWLPSIGVSRGSAMAASSPTVPARLPIRTNVLPL